MGIEVGSRLVVLDDGEKLHYTLVIATGATHAYFGHDEWERFAPGLKLWGMQQIFENEFWLPF